MRFSQKIYCNIEIYIDIVINTLIDGLRQR